MDIANKKITIIGAKKSGLSLVRLVLKLNGIVKISEHTTFDFISQELKKIIKENNIEAEFNGHTRAFIEDSDIVILSPGVRFDSEVVSWVKTKGLPILGEIEFAFQFCDKPIIAVTGSNGKTTVANLIHQILEASGFKSCLCGNVGSPFSDYITGFNDIDYVVLEVSSFQLESLLKLDSIFRNNNKTGFCFKGFKPFIASFLNFNKNHLDRHRDMNDYFNAKRRIFLNQNENDYAVLNYMYEELRKLANEIKSKVVYFNKHNNDDEEVNPNHSAVIEIVKILNVDIKLCEKVIKEFKGVEHRLEFVRNFCGIDFINDSKATTAESGLWAIRNINKPIILICGGRDKNIDFSVLRNYLKNKVKRIKVFGESKKKIKDAIIDVIDVEECNSLEESIYSAKKSAAEGDCVLLSPMCTSFDMFSNYEERGKVFKEIVSKL